MPARSTLVLALGGSVLLLLAFGVTSTAAASSVVECGQLIGYSPPEPAGSVDGTVQLGLSDTWTILADATVSPAASTVLPAMVDSGPTCLAMELDDDGRITALDFSATGSISGTVGFDTGSGFYIFDDRLIIPTFVTDANVGLAALFVTSYQAGSTLTVTFSVDTTTGGFTGFAGTAGFCGQGSVTSDGDGQVGDATIPASVLDPGDLEALTGAGTRETCATIRTVGSIDPQTGAIDTATDVDIDVAAPGVIVTPPPTSTAPAGSGSDAAGVPLLAWLVGSLVIAIVVAHRSERRTGRQ